MIISKPQVIEFFQSPYYTSVKEGLFIVFEGINGSGKTTLIDGFQKKLDALSLTVRRTREPGATELGLRLRELLLEANRTDTSICPLAELLLFAADRAQHVEEFIKPALLNDEVVLSDRYHYSTLAFQGFGRELNTETVKTINSVATTGTEPDLVILLDLPVEEGLKRIRQRNHGKDVFEKELVEFHNRVRSGYLKIAEESSTPFLILDASLSAAKLQNELEPLVQSIKRLKASKAAASASPQNKKAANGQ